MTLLDVKISCPPPFHRTTAATEDARDASFGSVLVRLASVPSSRARANGAPQKVHHKLVWPGMRPTGQRQSAAALTSDGAGSGEPQRPAYWPITQSAILTQQNPRKLALADREHDVALYCQVVRIEIEILVEMGETENLLEAQSALSRADIDNTIHGTRHSVRL